jgi:hypothetical protein
MADHPEVRASDADREHTAELLRRAAGEGRLTVDELCERLDAAFAARTRGELERLVADVVVEGGAAHGAVAAAPSRVPVREGEGGSRWLVSIMSGCDRMGHWRLAPRAININFWGGSDLDLNDVELAAQRTELRVISIMGGADIRVPDGLAVEVSQFAFMGGNDVRLGAQPADGGGPVLHLTLFSLMGGTNVRRGRRLTREERRALKEERRAERRIERGE